ncbi:NAD-binding protein [Lactococcus garvieae]
MKSFVVIGLGRFGSAVAKTIAETEADLLVIDQNEDRVNLLRIWFLMPSLPMQKMSVSWMR